MNPCSRSLADACRADGSSLSGQNMKAEYNIWGKSLLNLRTQCTEVNNLNLFI
jgi:hypothetical protein